MADKSTCLSFLQSHGKSNSLIFDFQFSSGTFKDLPVHPSFLGPQPPRRKHTSAHLSPTVQRSFLRSSVHLGHEGRCLIISSLYPHLRLASATPTLRDYASLDCVAFPQITQIAACCTFGTHRIPRTCTFGVVAADSKSAAFQQS
jgi:hypothetical protein